jgi:hypothetical protein
MRKWSSNIECAFLATLTTHFQKGQAGQRPFAILIYSQKTFNVHAQYAGKCQKRNSAMDSLIGPSLLHVCLFFLDSLGFTRPKELQMGPRKRKRNEKEVGAARYHLTNICRPINIHRDKVESCHLAWYENIYLYSNVIFFGIKWFGILIKNNKNPDGSYRRDSNVSKRPAARKWKL